MPGAANSQKPETEPPAKCAESAIVLAAFAPGRHARCEPDLVTCRGAVDTLKNQFEIELQFQFADDDNGRLAVAQPHDIAASNFTFDDEIQALKEPLHRHIKGGFVHAGGIVAGPVIAPARP